MTGECLDGLDCLDSPISSVMGLLKRVPDSDVRQAGLFQSAKLRIFRDIW